MYKTCSPYRKLGSDPVTSAGDYTINTDSAQSGGLFASTLAIANMAKEKAGLSLPRIQNNIPL